MPGADPTTSSGIYCRKCGYDLRAQVAPHRCPECGRDFDPTNRKTFRSRPPRAAFWQWAKWTAFLLFLLALVLAMGWGWLFWGWRNEQAALAKLAVKSPRVEPLGGKELKDHLGPAAWILDRVTGVALLESTSDANLIAIRDLRGLRALDMVGAHVTDAGLVHLKELAGLQTLDLQRTQITDAGLATIKEMPSLRSLRLYRTQITDAGLVHLTALKELQSLYLSDTPITDAGLIHLQELKGLRLVLLRGTKVTAKGVDKLRKELPDAKIVWQ